MNNILLAEKEKVKQLVESKQSIKNLLLAKFKQLRSENERLQSLNLSIVKTQKSLTQKEMKIDELHNAIGLVKNLVRIENLNSAFK